jgi:DNA-binding PadR family transcriptional regulator
MGGTGVEKDIYGGLIRLHVLHHACHEPVYGLHLIKELSRHGYKVGPGTMYPILHGLEKAGFLESAIEKAGARNRRVYRATKAGCKALKQAKGRVSELFRELFEDELSEPAPKGRSTGGKAT